MRSHGINEKLLRAIGNPFLGDDPISMSALVVENWPLHWILAGEIYKSAVNAETQIINRSEF